MDAAGSRATGRDIDPVTGKKRLVYECPRNFVTDEISADCKLSVARKHSTLILWELDAGKKRVTLGQEFRLTATSFSPDRRTLAIGTGDLAEPGELQLWDTSSGQKTAVLKGHTNVISQVTFSPDGKSLASGGWEGTVRIWDPLSLRAVRILGSDKAEDRDGVLCIAYSPDGKILAAGTEQHSVKLWDLTSKKQVATVTLKHVDCVVSLGFSSDGKTLAAGSGNPVDLTPGRCELKIWDLPRILGAKK